MSFIKKLILSALISTPALAQQNSIIENLVDQKPSPNVILIVADDMAYGDFSYYGNRWINTPHFDALAANSLR